MTRHTESFRRLSDFILNRMRMSHIYQPVMLMELLRREGQASVTEIARSLLSFDPSQVEYYEQVVKNMVGRVLTRNHEIAEREKNIYRLIGYDRLEADEVKELIGYCREKLDEYIQKRGDRIWQHRRRSGRALSGTLRYRVLKRSGFRCDLCGVAASERALEVDHIIPRNHGGTDDPSNLQALCYVCNASKRDRDDTDFREVRKSYETVEPYCVFCEVDDKRVRGENELVVALEDQYPVTELHTLLIPKRHIETYFDLYQPEINAIHSLMREFRDRICKQDASVTGFNVGVNNGRDAGQTVNHCHLHLIPRRKGDLEDPRGGVRGVIPEKRIYEVG